MASDTGARADAILAELELPEGAQRDACVVLAGVAIGLAGGDMEAARESLTEVLTAIGAIEYEPGAVLTMWGTRPRNRPDTGEVAG